MNANNNKNKFKFNLEDVKKIDDKTYVSFEINDDDFSKKFYGTVNRDNDIPDEIINGENKAYVNIENFDIYQIKKKEDGEDDEYMEKLCKSGENKKLYMSSGFKEALFDKDVVSGKDVDDLFGFSDDKPISIDKLDSGNFFKISMPGEEGDENVKYFGIDDNGNLFLSNADKENKGYYNIRGEESKEPISYMEYPGLVAKIK